MPKAIPLFLIALLALPAAALAQAVAPRAVVESIAAGIEDNYFDPARAAEIAATLRSEAAQGAYDGLTDPYALAAALSDRLRPLDGHFGVAWSEAGEADEASAESAHGGYGIEQAVRRSAYGFRSVELLPGNIGLIDMRFFAPIDFDAGDDPARRTADAALELVAGADALIVDLRANGGGSPAMVGYLASAFVAPGRDVYNVFHGGEGTESEAPGEAYPRPRTDLPVFVLTSGRTGSAAEALAYTLQAAGRATIVGEASAGAANPGGEIEVGDGFSIFVSTGSPRNPLTGGNWEGTGVVPEVPVPAEEAFDAAYALALRAALERIPEAERIDARWALEAAEADPALAASLDPTAYAGDYEGWIIAGGNGALILRRGRRPEQRLVPLGDDLFFVEGLPDVRYAFLRDASGTVATLEQRINDGSVARRTRTASE